MRQALALLVVVSLVGTTLGKPRVNDEEGLKKKAKPAAVRPRFGKIPPLTVEDLERRNAMERRKGLGKGLKIDPLQQGGDALRNTKPGPARKSGVEEQAPMGVAKVMTVREMMEEKAERLTRKLNPDQMKKSASKPQN